MKPALILTAAGIASILLGVGLKVDWPTAVIVAGFMLAASGMFGVGVDE